MFSPILVSPFRPFCWKPISEFQPVCLFLFLCSCFFFPLQWSLFVFNLELKQELVMELWSCFSSSSSSSSRRLTLLEHWASSSSSSSYSYSACHTDFEEVGLVCLFCNYVSGVVGYGERSASNSQSVGAYSCFPQGREFGLLWCASSCDCTCLRSRAGVVWGCVRCCHHIRHLPGTFPRFSK